MKRSRIKPIGARSTRRKPALDACYQEVNLRSQGWCEARVENVCTGRAHERHHIGKRSVWPELVTDPLNVIAICRPCHTWADENQRAASELGLHRFRGDPRVAVRDVIPGD